MAMMFAGPVAIMMMLLGGMSNDLLDAVPTEAYWKAHHGVESVTAESIRPFLAADSSEPGDIDALIGRLGHERFAEREDATRRLMAMGPAALPAIRRATESDELEIATRAREIKQRLMEVNQQKAIDRLMAIRTLGELKDRESLPALRNLTRGDDPMVADYARGAIDRIEGRKWVRPVTSRAELEQDLALVSGDMGIVGQFQMLPMRENGGVDAILKALPRELVGEPEALTNEIMRELIGVAYQTGNFRISSVTFGVSEEVGSNVGRAVFVVRGLYNPTAVTALLTESMRAVSVLGGQPHEPKVIHGQRFIAMKPEVAYLHMPAPDRLIFVAGANDRELKLQELAQLLRDQPRTPAFAPEMQALINRVDRNRPMWVAARLKEDYQKALGTEVLDSIIFSMRLDDGRLRLEAQARGENADEVAELAGNIRATLDEGIAELEGEAERVAALKPMADFVKSIRIEARDGIIEARGDMGENAGFVLPMFWMMSGSQARGVQGVEADAAPMPQPLPAE
ncbi:MAG: hypothetical protein JJU36_09570 [Phycisphaeraceae bacterium]|nr:hypothetical protein [Phycisphaeraceae bacterium]